MSEKILEIKDERLSFFTPAGEVKALNGVSFSMNQGDVLGIVGESGSGKSVTAYSIMGLTAYPGRLVGGTVWFNGHQIDKMTEKEFRKIRGNEVSIIFQDPMTSLNPVFRIGAQLDEVIALHDGEGKTPEDMMQLALAGFDPNVLDERTVQYQCDCSAERTKEMLLSLGRAELVRMRDEDLNCEVVCHFCHSKYQYDLDDLLAEYDAQAAERAAAEQGT